MKKTFLVLAVIASALTVSACGWTDTVRDFAYPVVAHQGNEYCENQNEDLRDALVNRFNEEVAARGGKWHFDGIVCEEAE